MRFNLLVKRLLELETLNKLKVISIDSNENKVKIEVEEKVIFVFVGKNIRIVERKYIQYENGNSTAKYTDGIAISNMRELEEYLNTIELTDEEKIKTKIIEVLDKQILYKRVTENGIEYSGDICGDPFRILIYNNNNDIDITYNCQNKEEQLYKESGFSAIKYKKSVNGFIVSQFKIHDNVYDTSILSNFFKALKLVSSNSHFGHLMYLVGEEIEKK